MPKTNNSIEVNDFVKVVFSDGHIEEGIVRKIFSESNFPFRVEIKVYGKSTYVYCQEKDLIKIREDEL